MTKRNPNVAEFSKKVKLNFQLEKQIVSCVELTIC